MKSLLQSPKALLSAACALSMLLSCNIANAEIKQTQDKPTIKPTISRPALRGGSDWALIFTARKGQVKYDKNNHYVLQIAHQDMQNILLVASSPYKTSRYIDEKQLNRIHYIGEKKYVMREQRNMIVIANGRPQSAKLVGYRRTPGYTEWDLVVKNADRLRPAVSIGISVMINTVPANDVGLCEIELTDSKKITASVCAYGLVIGLSKL